MVLYFFLFIKNLQIFSSFLVRVCVMGSPESEDDGNRANSIDPTVGGLVWVRRRNGSWWPGRILSLDEVSEGCLVSPRSGTPVKLLGREDASV